MVRNIEVEKVKQSRLPEVDFDNLVFGRTFADHMFMADYANGKWSDGKILPFQPLEFYPSLVALHYGSTIFEGLKAFKHSNGEIRVFRPDMHAERMESSAERLCMAKFPKEDFLQGLNSLLNVDSEWIPDRKGYSLYIRPIMFSTEQYLGVAPSNSFKFLIITCPVGKYYSGAVKVKVETEYTRAAEGGTGYIKMGGNYAASLLPTKKALDEGYQQIIWTDGKEHKYIEECGTMNIMFQIGDTIVTPEVSSSILPGITRMSILELARKWGYKVEERKVSVAEVVEAFENGQLLDAFGTGTAATITHISTIHFNGTDYDIAPSAEREFSNRVSTYMNKLKFGEEEDFMNWMTKIN